MGRRKDPPALQAAKGYPGRRRGQVEREIEEAAAAAAAEPVNPAEPYPVPGLFLRDPEYWRRATEIWRAQAEVLKASGRQRPGYRGPLTRYCMWSQYVDQAADTLRRDCPGGELTMTWEMGHGATKVLPHPSFRILESAEPILRLLETEFGFTPRGDQYIHRVETFNAAQPQLPFGHTGAAAAAQGGAPPAREADDLDPLDLMKDADSPPPGLRPN